MKDFECLDGLGAELKMNVDMSMNRRDFVRIDGVKPDGGGLIVMSSPFGGMMVVNPMAVGLSS